MNQNAPAAMTTTDPANASWRPAVSLRARSAASAVATTSDDQQLTDLDADVEREQRPAERARRQVHLAQHVGEAEAVDEAEGERNPGAHVAAVADQQVVGADVDDAERDRRLDDPRRRADEVQRRERQRDAVRDGERGDDERELAERAAEQQQPDEEQQVVRTDQDVVDARRQELLDDRERALARAGEVLELACGRASRIACVSASPS